MGLVGYGTRGWNYWFVSERDFRQAAGDLRKAPLGVETRGRSFTAGC
jgi:hypothetical protein